MFLLKGVESFGVVDVGCGGALVAASGHVGTVPRQGQAPVKELPNFTN